MPQHRSTTARPHGSQLPTRAAHPAAAMGPPRARQGQPRDAPRSHRRRHRYYERFTASSFASGDIFADDVTAGEDPVVRQAAIDALGDMNGTAVVIDPSNGRILAMVNQKLALSPGAEPCSTIKITVAMAALSEGLVTRDTPVQLRRLPHEHDPGAGQEQQPLLRGTGPRARLRARPPLCHAIWPRRAGRL